MTDAITAAQEALFVAQKCGPYMEPLMREVRIWQGVAAVETVALFAIATIWLLRRQTVID